MVSSAMVVGQWLAVVLVVLVVRWGWVQQAAQALLTARAWGRRHAAPGTRSRVVQACE